jgi:hypothetical protein
MLAPHGNVAPSSLPQKGMFINEPICVKQSPDKLFCTGLCSDRRENLETMSKYFLFFIYALNYNMASTVPILITLILTERRYVKIFCTQFTQIHQQIWKSLVEIH